MKKFLGGGKFIEGVKKFLWGVKNEGMSKKKVIRKNFGK